MSNATAIWEITCLTTGESKDVLTCAPHGEKMDATVRFRTAEGYQVRVYHLESDAGICDFCE